MAVTIKVVSNTGYVEDDITVSITKGTLPSNSQIQIFAKISEQYFLDLYTTSISGTSKTFKIPSVNLNSLYAEIPNTANVKLIFSIFKNESSISNQITKTMYIKPDLPTFNVVPTYADISLDATSFSNDNQMIVRGLSTISITELKGVAKKGATLQSINVNNNIYNYEDAISSSEITNGKILIYFSSYQQPFTYLDISLIDSRGFASEPIRLADISKFKYSYQTPKITEMTVEHDGVSETTNLYVRGYYSEGYSVGANPLYSSYRYIENTEGATEHIGITSLTITKTPTFVFQDYLDILEEYNNPHYIIQPGNVGLQYYPKATFEDDIQSLFETAIRYNNKYTQEYLEEDFASSTQRYYCLSGGYRSNGSWKTFWQDTLIEIYKQIYGNNVYGTNIVGDEDGGNYEFEINMSIKGDTPTGFSIDKSFYVTFNITDEMQSGLVPITTEKTELLLSAIPAVDIYRSKVSLHGLFDETFDESDIQLWGNVFLNGSKINSGVLQMVQTANLDTLSTNYNYFPLFYSSSEIDVPVSTTDKLVLDHKTINYGDRTNSTVYGVTIGSGVELIRVNFSARYLNNHTANQSISTSIFVYKNNSSSVVYGCSTTAGSNNRLTETGNYYLEVEEGDFVFLVGWRATKTADVDAIASNNAINMAIEIIS